MVVAAAVAEVLAPELDVAVVTVVVVVDFGVHLA